ncbi:MAG: ice-binding family protein [Bacteroidales bacterium]|nr:ice-binding family protein [Bacteroidales bacterium]
MKTSKLLTTLAIVSVVLIAGCKKDVETSIDPMGTSTVPLNYKSGLAVVDLGVAGDFVILSKSGIIDVFPSAITGDVGSSPITGAAILVSCAEVTGTIYTVDAAGPLPCRVTNASMLTTAVSDMEAAYTDAAGRANPDFSELGAGDIGGLTLTPGLYKWTSAVIIPTDIYISGGPNDVWIFQVAGTLTMSSAVKITLSGGAQANNIFWQAAGAVTFGTTSHFEGNILGNTGINLQTGASINGRILAQTAVSLQMNTVSFTTGNAPDTILPTVNSTVPLNNATGVANNTVVALTFSEAMDPSTINTSTFTLKQGTTAVSGTVAYSGTTATFTPSNILAASTEYTATITTGAKDLAGNALAANTVWSFTTAGTTSGLAVVDLGVAGDFVILSKTGITDVFPSAITGDVGSSPITGAAILVSCAEVTGTIYTVDAAGPLPCRVTNASMLTTAVSDMEAAYTDAAGRPNPDFLNLGAGNIGGLTLTPGLYKWTSTVIIPTDVTISGGPDDVWIFQVAGLLTMSSAVNITLSGGAQAKNIFWQVSGVVTFGTTSHFEGIILGMTGINLQTGGSINGRMLAQTAVTLQMNTVTQPY